MMGGRWWAALGLGAALMGAEAHAAEIDGVPLQRPRAGRTAPVDATPVEATPVDATPVDVVGREAAPTPAQSVLAAPTTSSAPRFAAANDPTIAASETPAPVVSHGGGSSAPALHREAKPNARRFRHDGFVTDFRIGALGCIRGLCNGGHRASPGFRLDGFLGGNIRGFVDFGIAGGWGTLGSDVTTGTNVLSLYGLDPFLLQQALGVIGGAALGVDLTTLNVQDTKLRAAQAGPLLRIHFIPRGRFAAYVGSGVQYNLFRARYGTTAGDAKLDFHGISVPVQAGFGVHVHPNVAVGLQFDYLWTWYALANLDHAGQSLTVPVRVLDNAAKMQGGDLRGQLPQFWTFGVGLRARI